MVSRRSRVVMFGALVAFACSAPAHSQSQEGRIVGVVRDASGGALPGATVTITNQATNVAQTATTGVDGKYSVSVPPGVYSAAVAFKGFAAQTQKELKVAAGGALTTDFTLRAALEEEVTVTSMLHETTVQNTPVSVTAMTETDLRSRSIDDVEDIARNVAGLSVQNLGPGQSQVAIRGVSSGQIARDQPGVKEQAGSYLDDSVISLSLFTPDIDLFDMNRIEVLRGPQGTLFGSGSESGTIRYITNQPQLGAKSVFGEFGPSTISGGNQGGNVKLGANAPLGDRAALRVAAYYNRLAGYMDAVQPGGSVKENVNTGDRYGVRAGVTIAPNDRLSITPKLVYQKVQMDGWNRIDAFNILANPYTTTRPPVTLGERELFTQVSEPFNDKFLLADLNITYNFGSVALTSITSYTDRDVDVVRDAGALTSSITGGSIGQPENVYTLNAPLDDATTAKVFTQEIRLSGATAKFKWVAGGFFADTKRDYGQTLLVAGFTELSGIPTQGLAAPQDVLFYSRLGYKLDQFALFGEGTLTLNDRFSLTGGLRYYHFSEDKTQIFDGIFGNDNNGKSLVSQPGSTDADGVAPRIILAYKAGDTTNLFAQVSKGFRLGGINDPLNVPLCTPRDLETFGGHTNWKDETAWNYEVDSKTRFKGGRATLNVSAFYMDVSNLQATVTAGSCSSRVVFNVPKSRTVGAEVEFWAAPNEHFDFSISGNYNDAKLKSTVTSTGSDGAVTVVSGIQDGNRLPSVPEFQMAIAATYRWQMKDRWLGYLTGIYQYVGSRYTQVGDQQPGYGIVDLLSFGKNTIGAPLTATTFTFDPLMPSYNVVNARLGVAKGKWDVALFGSNLTDERAFLALDRERDKRARVGYLTNQPRTFGISAKFAF